MNIFAMLLDSPFIHRLGWTLVHFLWQGAAVGLIYLCLRHLLKGRSPQARYHLALGTMAVLAALPVITFLHLAGSVAGVDPQLAVHAVNTVTASPAHSSAAVQNSAAGMQFSVAGMLRHWLQPLIPWAVPLWLLGVCIASIRVFRSWRNAYRISSTATFIHLEDWQTKVQQLCLQFGIRKVVRLAVSAGVVVPSVIGWLKPIILIPPSTLAGLTPKQMELILAHELAHICRQDYFWNLLQVAVETLLFYHPVVGLISRQARIERDLCCDDMVVGLHGNALAYARALTELETLRQPQKALLLGADGGQMFNRIQRLLCLRAQATPVFWLPLLVLSGLLLAATITQVTHQRLPLEPTLTSRYTLLGNQPQQLSPTVNPALNVPGPLKVSTPALAKPATLRTIPMADAATRVAEMSMPELQQPVSAPPQPAVNKLMPENPTVNNNYAAVSVTETRAPVYPEFALERGVEGSARVEFTLTANGEISGMHVTHVTGSILFGQAAMDALHKWKFVPASVGGVPVAQHMVEDFVYRLKDGSGKSGTCNIPMGYHVCVPN